jgi:hypothetical protein
MSKREEDEILLRNRYNANIEIGEKRRCFGDRYLKLSHT